MRVIYLILSIIFIILGIIGLVLPIVPQIPLFLLGFAFLAAYSKRFKNYIKSTKLYRKHANCYINKIKFLKTIFEE